MAEIMALMPCRLALVWSFSHGISLVSPTFPLSTSPPPPLLFTLLLFDSSIIIFPHSGLIQYQLSLAHLKSLSLNLII